MSQGNVSNNGREPSETDVFFHVIISIIHNINRRTDEMIIGIKEGSPTIETAIALPMNIHHAHEQLLKNILAPVLSFLAV